MMKEIQGFPYGACPEGQRELISVIVTVYNIAPYLKHSIPSLLGQSYRELEFLLVDDGSTDESPALLDAWAQKDERIRVLHRENGGPSAARNAGLAEAKGRYIGFVDGDDWIDPDYYENLMAALKACEADLAVSRYRNEYGTQDLTVQPSCREEKPAEADTDTARTDVLLLLEGQEALEAYVREEEDFPIKNAVWNKLYRRELLEGIAFPEGKWYEDILYTTYLLGRVKRCVFLDRAGYHYRIDRAGSIMNTGVNPRIFTDQLTAYEKKTAYLKELGREDLAALHDYHYYRRLLLLYRDFAGAQKPGGEEACARIEELVRGSGERLEAAYARPEAAAEEKKRLALFRKDPKKLLRYLDRQERLVIPLKRKAKAFLGRGGER